jgi:hypothetical protein
VRVGRAFERAVALVQDQTIAVAYERLWERVLVGPLARVEDAWHDRR